MVDTLPTFDHYLEHELKFAKIYFKLAEIHWPKYSPGSIECFQVSLTSSGYLYEAELC